MNKNNLSYSEQKQSKKKIILILTLFLSAAIITIGTVFAFFSDVVEKSGDVKSSTLNIDGSYTIFLNGTQTELESITSLNPGDVIVVKGAFTNSGEQSAWIREKVALESSNANLLNFIKVYNGEFTSADLIEENAQEENRINTIEGGAFVSGNSVINGLGTDARTESTGEYNYLDTNIYNPTLTIYFMHSAPNETQNLTFSLALTTQALQFINNNSTVPSEAAWASVEAVI